MEFPDYDADELLGILRLMAKKREYTLDEDAYSACRDYFQDGLTEENFGNGRYVRILLVQEILRQSE